MKKKIISVILACVMLMACVVSVYAYSDYQYVGSPYYARTYVSITWYAETVTAFNDESHETVTDSYCRAYIRYDNGEYFYTWNNSGGSPVSTTATHTVYPPSATRISVYETYHKVTQFDKEYSRSFIK